MINDIQPLFLGLKNLNPSGLNLSTLCRGNDFFGGFLNGVAVTDYDFFGVFSVKRQALVIHILKRAAVSQNKTSCGDVSYAPFHRFIIKVKINDFPQ